MKRRYSRLGLVFAAVYLAVFLYAELDALPYFNAHSPLWGVAVMLITAPWCLIFDLLPNGHGFIFASLPMVLGAIINAVILYYIGKGASGGFAAPPPTD